MKKKTQGLNDGYAGFYSPKEQKTDFSALVSPKKMEDLDYFVDMAYQEQYKRDQDYEFADSIGHELSLKIRTLSYDQITKEQKVVIEDTIYNILKIDHSREDRDVSVFRGGTEAC